MKVRVTEKFSYDINVPEGVSIEKVLSKKWKMKDSVDCVEDMTCPFWDGEEYPEEIDYSWSYSINSDL